MTQRNDNRQITTDNQSESMAYRAQAFKEADNIIAAHAYNKHLLCIGLDANIVIFTPLL